MTAADDARAEMALITWRATRHSRHRLSPLSSAFHRSIGSESALAEAVNKQLTDGRIGAGQAVIWSAISRRRATGRRTIVQQMEERIQGRCRRRRDDDVLEKG
ncbi:unnamed protein product [Heligmosomoides polygyrus]|uniref:Transposase n=1 Tax=Heligmosomoides polygyrus TaxID=6339 RepID=A0A183F2C6_HELPZ|nr:unnamed protein product [Heligmosomoides polygyrus]